MEWYWVGLLTLLVAVGFIASHEMAHVVINEYWGCTSKWIFLQGGALVGIVPTCPKINTDIFYLAHAINEAIGYTFLLPLGVLISLKLMEVD